MTSPTDELFHLRRIAVVDSFWHGGFVLGFLLSGIVVFGALSDNLGRSPAMGMLLYIIAICVVGLASGIVGAGIGHVVATIWERWDLKHHPRP